MFGISLQDSAMRPYGNLLLGLGVNYAFAFKKYILHDGLSDLVSSVHLILSGHHKFSYFFKAFAVYLRARAYLGCV